MAARKNAAMGFVDFMLDGGPRSAALLARLDEATPGDKLARPMEIRYDGRSSEVSWFRL